MTTTLIQVRNTFLDYFASNGHEVVPSSGLVPHKDPTLLFTNAGMVQFKDVFLGIDKRPYSRAASSQRCVRAGGKHNDLEKVGYTARHHTFFEMLGNFSFGDYFKQSAINYAWGFLTDVIKLPPEKLWVTVYNEDDEAADIWLKELSVDKNRFSRIGAADNFWSMGEVGPCGPCSEIFYDHGPSIAGGPPGSPDADGDRFVEIWNLVFMQFNRQADGALTPLPKPSVDTGMGLERLAAVLQGVHNNFEIDIFKHLITVIAEILKVSFADKKSKKISLEHSLINSLRVIADHIRASAFLITDGVLPSNEGRGYVLRRIIRRAARHGYELGEKEPFFYRIVDELSKEMSAAYPELKEAQSHVETVLQQEEERFAETLTQGMKILDNEIKHLAGKTLPGHVVFKLYDTYGFPVDLTQDILNSHALSIDMKGFEQEMNAQRERARSTSKFGVVLPQNVDGIGPTVFTGYNQVMDQAEVIGLTVAGQSENEIKAGQEGTVILSRTPFYAESGGQVGDQGVLVGSHLAFNVWDTQKYMGAVISHIGKVSQGQLRVGDTIRAEVNAKQRRDTAYNHSATHLMHAALRQVLGKHVVQKGSLVEPTRLRFDFSHFKPISADEIKTVELIVNEQIRLNLNVQTDIMNMEDAVAQGALALFGEKYSEQVRVLQMGDFSVELCGGTHVNRTGDIGLFRIISETGVAAGVRRIEALTAQHAFDWMEGGERQLSKIAGLMRTDVKQVNVKVGQLLERHQEIEKELEKLKKNSLKNQINELIEQAVDINGVSVIATRIEPIDVSALRAAVDQLKQKLASAVVMLVTVVGDKITVVVGVTQDINNKVKAGELVNFVALQIGGKGGGRPDMAQGGGNKPAMLNKALADVPAWVQQKIG